MNRLPGRILLAASLLGTAAAAARADDSDGWHPLFALDVLTVGNAGKHNLNAAKNDCLRLVAAGSTACAGTAATAGAYGARLGAYYRSGPATFGLSAGYLSGGPTAGKETLTTTPAGSLTRKTTNAAGRALVEFGRQFPLSDTWAFGLGAGGGAALVGEKVSCSDSGALTGTCAASARKSPLKRGWGAWELSVSLLYRSLELSVRYAGFGRRKSLPWSAFGASVGGRF